MDSITIREFFNGKYFEIPKYQRGYAWDKTNIRELFDDIEEAKEATSGHYIGTIVLSKTDKDRLFYVVDGQQRIATITLIINSIIKYFEKDDTSWYHRFYIKEGKYRIRLLGKDKEVFRNILEEKVVNAQSKSQRLLIQANEEIEHRISNTKNRRELLRLVEQLELLQFIEDSEGDAIRIFQTVNDRGKQLTIMEKVKSLLVYFSNKYLKKQYDSEINDYFGEIFEIYDYIKYTGEELNINLISSKEFNEDNIMRYHFVTFSDEDYNPTAAYVLAFLKERLNELRNRLRKGGEKESKKLENFILEYIESLYSFFKSLKNVIKRCHTNEKYFKLFSILGLSATLYPFVVKLEDLGLLDKNLPDKEYQNYSFLDLIELIDVRIYKMRGDPRAGISRFTYSINKKMKDYDIQDWLLWYNKKWMSQAEFQNLITSDVYRKNKALVHIFIDYCEHLSNKKFSISELEKITTDSRLIPTTEHILAQKPKFTLKSHNFKSTEEYYEYEGTLGNLTILEKHLNSAVQNKNTFEKVPFYDKSRFKMTKIVASEISDKKAFRKENISERTKIIAEYLINRWWC